MISVLVKPASGLCNMACRYCFYRDEVENREHGQRGIMSANTAETMIKAIFAAAKKNVTIAFQGGEPTLAGEDYFDLIASLVQKYNTAGLPVNYAIQTNGVAISTRMIDIFRRDNYLVGVSLDGDARLHDANRIMPDGTGTHATVLQNARRMIKAGVYVNILSVLTDENAKNAAQTYKYLTSRGFDWLQFIYSLPSLDSPLENQRTGGRYLTPQRWLEANIALFDLWYRDVMADKKYNVRHLDNYLLLYSGYPAESCDLRGQCSIQFVIEADGSVYPCDFYALDDFKLGDISEGLDALRLKKKAVDFTGYRQFADKCRACKWARLCRGGCRRYFVEGQYLYCEVTGLFFEYTIERYKKLAEKFDKL